MATPRREKYADRTMADPKIKVSKLGDGLSDNVPVEPIDLKIGDRVWIAVEGVVVGDDYKAGDRKNPSDGNLGILYEIDATACAFVDRDLLAGALAEQAQRNAEAPLEAQKAAEAEAGIIPLYDTDVDGSEKKPARSRRKKETDEDG